MKRSQNNLVKTKLAGHIRRHPEETYAVMSQKLRISVTHLCRIARESGVVRREPRSIVAGFFAGNSFARIGPTQGKEKRGSSRFQGITTGGDKVPRMDRS
jgi:hypothetical protein